MASTERLGRSFQAAFSQILRTRIDLDPSGTNQQLYADFIGSLPNPCTVYRFELVPPNQDILLVFDHALLSAAIEQGPRGPGQSPWPARSPLDQNRDRHCPAFGRAPKW